MRILVVLLLTAPLMAGCTGSDSWPAPPDGFGARPGSAPVNVTFEVLGVTTTYGMCFHGMDPEAVTCHRMEVRIENNMRATDVELDWAYFEWTAWDDGWYEAAGHKGPDRVGPGENATVEIQVEAEAGHAFKKLRYTPQWTATHVEGPVPAYTAA